MKKNQILNNRRVYISLLLFILTGGSIFLLCQQFAVSNLATLAIKVFRYAYVAPYALGQEDGSADTYTLGGGYYSAPTNGDSTDSQNFSGYTVYEYYYPANPEKNTDDRNALYSYNANGSVEMSGNLVVNGDSTKLYNDYNSGSVGIASNKTASGEIGNNRHFVSMEAGGNDASMNGTAYTNYEWDQENESGMGPSVFLNARSSELEMAENYYLSSSKKNAIIETSLLSEEGEYVWKEYLNGESKGKLNNPTAFFYRDGVFAIADMGNRRIVAYNPLEGSFGSLGRASWDWQLNGITANEEGIIFVTDSTNDVVIKTKINGDEWEESYRNIDNYQSRLFLDGSENFKVYKTFEGECTYDFEAGEEVCTSSEYFTDYGINDYDQYDSTQSVSIDSEGNYTDPVTSDYQNDYIPAYSTGRIAAYAKILDCGYNSHDVTITSAKNYIALDPANDKPMMLSYDQGDCAFGGDCFSFDGHEYIDLPDAAAWNFGNDYFTIDMWVKFNSLSHTMAIVSHPGSFLFELERESYQSTASTSLNFSFSSIGADGSHNAHSFRAKWPVNRQGEMLPEIGEWYHVAMVRSEKNELTMYVDGEVVGTPTNIGETLVDGVGRLQIGAYYKMKRMFGQIDEIRIARGHSQWEVNYSDRYKLNDPKGIILVPEVNDEGLVEDFLYIVDSGHNRIVRMSTDFHSWSTFGGPEPGSGNFQFNNPTDIYYHEGDFYITDTGNSRVIRTNIAQMVHYLKGTSGGSWEVVYGGTSDDEEYRCGGDGEFLWKPISSRGGPGVLLPSTFPMGCDVTANGIEPSEVRAERLDDGRPVVFWNSDCSTFGSSVEVIADCSDGTHSWTVENNCECSDGESSWPIEGGSSGNSPGLSGVMVDDAGSLLITDAYNGQVIKDGVAIGNKNPWDLLFNFTSPVDLQQAPDNNYFVLDGISTSDFSSSVGNRAMDNYGTNQKEGTNVRFSTGGVMASDIRSQDVVARLNDKDWQKWIGDEAGPGVAHCPEIENEHVVLSDSDIEDDNWTGLGQDVDCADPEQNPDWPSECVGQWDWESVWPTCTYYVPGYTKVEVCVEKKWCTDTEDTCPSHKTCRAFRSTDSGIDCAGVYIGNEGCLYSDNVTLANGSSYTPALDHYCCGGLGTTESEPYECGCADSQTEGYSYCKPVDELPSCHEGFAVAHEYLELGPPKWAPTPVSSDVPAGATCTAEQALNGHKSCSQLGKSGFEWEPSDYQPYDGFKATVKLPFDASDNCFVTVNGEEGEWMSYFHGPKFRFDYEGGYYGKNVFVVAACGFETRTWIVPNGGTFYDGYGTVDDTDCSYTLEDAWWLYFVFFDVQALRATIAEAIVGLSPDVSSIGTLIEELNNRGYTAMEISESVYADYSGETFSDKCASRQSVDDYFIVIEDGDNVFLTRLFGPDVGGNDSWLIKFVSSSDLEDDIRTYEVGLYNEYICDIDNPSCDESFLWKPVSETRGGVAVILLPSDFPNDCDMTVNGESPMEDSGETNGGRPTFFFAKEGCDYGLNVDVLATCGDGEHKWLIQDGCYRSHPCETYDDSHFDHYKPDSWDGQGSSIEFCGDMPRGYYTSCSIAGIPMQLHDQQDLGRDVWTVYNTPYLSGHIHCEGPGVPDFDTTVRAYGQQNGDCR